MRKFWLALAAVFYIGGIVVVSIALRARGSDSEEAAVYVSLIAVGLVLPPLLAAIGAALSTLDMRTADGRRARTRFLLVIVGMQVVATAGLVVYSVSFGLPVATVIALPVGAVILTALMVVIGGRLRRPTDVRERLEPASRARPYTRAEVTAKMRRIAVTVIVVFVILTAGIAVLVAIVGVAEAGFPDPWPVYVVVDSLGFAMLCGGAAASVVSLPALGVLQRQGRTVAERRAITRAVLKNRPEVLPEDSLLPAARYAALYSAYLPFQWTQLGLFLGGLFLLQVTSLLDGSGDLSLVNRVVPIIGAAALLFLAVVLPRQARNVRRYAADSAHLLEPAPA